MGLRTGSHPAVPFPSPLISQILPCTTFLLLCRATGWSLRLEALSNGKSLKKMKTLHITALAPAANLAQAASATTTGSRRYVPCALQTFGLALTTISGAACRLWQAHSRGVYYGALRSPMWLLRMRFIPLVHSSPAARVVPAPHVFPYFVEYQIVGAVGDLRRQTIITVLLFFSTCFFAAFCTTTAYIIRLRLLSRNSPSSMSTSDALLTTKRTGCSDTC